MTDSERFLTSVTLNLLKAAEFDGKEAFFNADFSNFLSEEKKQSFGAKSR